MNQISGTWGKYLVACQLNSSSHLNCPVRGGADDVVAVWSEGGFVHEGGVAAELLQSFARFKPVDSEKQWNFLNWMNLMNIKQRKVNQVDWAVLVFTWWSGRRRRWGAGCCLYRNWRRLLLYCGHVRTSADTGRSGSSTPSHTETHTHVTIRISTVN